MPRGRQGGRSERDNGGSMRTTDPVLKVERSGNCVTFILNRPEKMNTINGWVLQALDEAMASVERDPEIRVVVLRGAGAAFSAGFDLRNRGSSRTSPPWMSSVFRRLKHLPVPTIAAIQDAAIGGGCQLAFNCDLRMATENLRMGVAIARVGLTLPFFVIRKTIEIIGVANTCEILFTAQPVNAQRALQMGMVHEIVPNGGLDEAIARWTGKVTANAPLALRAMKKSLRRAMYASFDAWHGDIEEANSQVFTSKDSQEGLRAFFGKRKPVWRAE